MVPDPALLDRFRADLDALIRPGARFGVAVSGGPDSLALLLLAAAARPSEFEVATVDHGLRPEAKAEADMVAAICERLAVPHSTLAIEWDLAPSTALQEQARHVRYGALAAWARERSLSAVLTAHHLDDQAETLLMRLNRGAGVGGLAGMRPAGIVQGAPDLPLLRPLLHWRRAELEQLCADAGIEPARDPSNSDERHERIRMRNALASAPWLDPEMLGRSAANLAAADEALAWAVDREWTENVEVEEQRVVYRASTAPAEIVRRVTARAIAQLGSEGDPEDLRGRELDHLITSLQSGRTGTLRGVRCSGGLDWVFARATPRNQ